MKKIVFLIILLMVLLSACSVKSLNSNTRTEEGPLNDYIIVDDTESTTTNTKITHNDIEKVIVTYLDKKEVFTEKQQSFDFIEDIKNCNTVPDTSMTAKIGDIKIKYVDKKDEIVFATLYLGLDGSVYAKYVENQDSEYAYRID
jgi:hypothetical protein